MPVSKIDLMRRYEVPSEMIEQCERVGILRPEPTGDLTCYTRDSFLRMEIYLKGRALGIGISECKILIEQAGEEARTKQVAYDRQLAAKRARARKLS